MQSHWLIWRSRYAYSIGSYASAKGLGTVYTQLAPETGQPLPVPARAASGLADTGPEWLASDRSTTLPPENLESVIRTLVSNEALARAQSVQRDSGERVDAVVTRLGLVTEDVLATALARSVGMPLVSATEFPAERVGPVLSVDFLRDMRCLPIALDDSGLTIALASPFDDFVLPAMRFATGLSARPVVARASDIDSAIERLYAAPAEDDADDGADANDLERLRDLVSDAPVIRAVNRLIAQAVDAHASDIHIEPTEDRLAVRFRIDGMLRDMPALPAAMRAPLVSRIKIMANLNIAERRLPQDGRMRVTVRGHEIDLRVATSPSIQGETVVMRILDRGHLSLDLASLGFDGPLEQNLRRCIAKPHGIMLVTGPTGSGKTTTLYALLSELNRQDSKLLTIEDPIEYRLQGIIQAQVNTGIGFTFSSALRSFLRQDPDVIMVGEIRDGETAQIAVQAALTGHLILSTLHTNTAAGSVTRLIDMGTEPFLLASVLNGVLAQRLVRRLCPHCRTPYRPGPHVAAHFERARQPVPEVLYHPGGCDACSGEGYVGRMAVFELLVVTPDIERLILTGADTRTIADRAVEDGMLNLTADGLAKAARGLTSLEEVLRVASGGE
jgi:general secretion pathway protein E